MAIRTDGSGSSCAVGFAVGQRWLIYAATGSDGALTTHLCSNNQLLAEQVPMPELAPSNGPATGNGIPLGVWVAVAAALAVTFVSALAFRRGAARN